MQIGKNRLLRCRHGWMLSSGPYIGKCFELYGEYSEGEVAVFRAVIKPGHSVIDVGANIGDLTVPMSLLAGAAGRVYAVESHSDTFNVLCANLALNGITNVRPINAFVADSEQTDTAGPWGAHGFVSQSWRPPFLAIDSLGLESCAFIKIDVDGKGLEVLRSAAATITRCRPVVYFENDVAETSAALLSHLMAQDYTLFWHPAPIWVPDNFFGNPVNHWAPTVMVSLMVLAIPNERAADFKVPFKPVSHKDEWWK
jgi:predicted RNA methylase